MNIIPREMKKVSILLLAVILSACSVFKSSTKKKESQTERTEMRDILTSTEEDISITIPPGLFAQIYGQNIERKDVREDTSLAKNEQEQKANKQPEQVTGPVKIRIHRNKKVQDNTTVETEEEETVEQEETVEKDTNLINGFKLFILVGGVVVIGIAIVVIKFYF